MLKGEKIVRLLHDEKFADLKPLIEEEVARKIAGKIKAQKEVLLQKLRGEK